MSNHYQQRGRGQQPRGRANFAGRGRGGQGNYPSQNGSGSIQGGGQAPFHTTNSHNFRGGDFNGSYRGGGDDDGGSRGRGGRSGPQGLPNYQGARPPNSEPPEDTSNEDVDEIGDDSERTLGDSDLTEMELSRFKEEFETRKSQNKEPKQEAGSGTIADFPLRKGFREPKKKVATNYFNLEIDKVDFFQYEFIGFPVGRNRTLLRAMFERAIEAIPILRDNKDQYAHDGLKTIISWTSLHDQIGNGKKEVENGHEFGPFDVADGKPQNGSQPTSSIWLKYSKKLDFGSLQHYAEGKEKNPTLWNSSTEVKALNILLSKCFHTSDMVCVGGSKFFDRRTMCPLRPNYGPPPEQCNSLYTVRGYFFTAKPAEGGLLVNVNSATSAFYNNVTRKMVSDFLADRHTFTSFSKRCDALKGVRVRINYGRGSTVERRREDMAFEEGRIKTIASVGNSLIAQKFPIKDEDGNVSRISVAEYLRSTYGPEKVSNERDHRAINLGTISNPSWYAPNHLEILPDQIYQRIVPENLIEKMLEVACKSPGDNMAWIGETLFRNNILNTHGGSSRTPGSSQSEGAYPFIACPHLRIKKRMLHVDSGQLRYPPILYGSTQKSPYVLNVKLPRWNLRGLSFLHNVLQISRSRVKLRLVLLIAPDLQSHETPERYKMEICNLLRTYQLCERTTNSVEEYYLSTTDIEVIRELLMDFSKPAGGEKIMIFLLLPRRNIAIYQAFKTLIDTKFGYHSICLTEAANWDNRTRSIKANLTPYFGNIMMKVNIKFGGTNHSTQKVQDMLKDTLVLGADVTHPGPGAIQGCPSIAAIVGSVDNNGKFLGSMRLQSKDKKDHEIIDEVQAMVTERLQAWRAHHSNRLPKNILYYRDGVSEGQYAKVAATELAAIRSAFATLSKTPIHLTALIAAKRHHTRFYPLHSADMEGHANNCQPGTVVDSGVTSPYFADFFLQSHSGLQGTARPTHYFVLEDGMRMGVDRLQEFTHELCYTYVRATTGVSYASPAYYADRLCDRGRAYIRGFLAGDFVLRRELNGRKRGWEKRFADVKKGVFPPGATGSDVVLFDAMVRERLETMCRRDTMGKVMALWGGGLNRNPWHADLNGSMFWM